MKIGSGLWRLGEMEAKRNARGGAIVREFCGDSQLRISHAEKVIDATKLQSDFGCKSVHDKFTLLHGILMQGGVFE